MQQEHKYLTYTEYQGYGGDLSESLFNIYEYRAEKKVDLYTFNRFSKIEEYPKELKLCIYDLLPIVSEKGSNILSESIGNYSITRKNTGEIETDIVNTIKFYLSNVKVNDVPVLYIGVDED